MLRRHLLACLALALALGGPVRAADPVTVFAAASLQGALSDVADGFEAATGQRVRLVHAGSSTLARQIQAGAPADIFISASVDWLDVLIADGLAIPASRLDLFSNRLVLIAHGREAPAVALSPDLDLAALLDGGRLAVALTRAVPAGIYAKAALTSLGLWEQAAAHLAETDNVRAALHLVALGEAPFGIVYATDAQAEDSVSVVATFPEAAHPPIVYPAALIAGRENRGAAFLKWLQGPESAAIFRAHGFLPLGE